jgi:hypothetical protein
MLLICPIGHEEVTLLSGDDNPSDQFSRPTNAVLPHQLHVSLICCGPDETPIIVIL